MALRAPLAALAIAVLSTSCMHREAHGVPVGSVSQSLPPQPIAYEYVPAGTTFRVALVQPLRTSYVLPGQVFRAVVLDKLISHDGRVLVPTGAMLTGRIAGADLGAIESVKLTFDTIDTIRGAAELHATVYGVERFRGGVAYGARNPEASGYDAVVVAPPQQAPSALGGGPLDEEATPRRAVVALPIGAQFTLALRRPLVMP